VLNNNIENHNQKIFVDRKLNAQICFIHFKNKDDIICEVGGTSLKMGSDIIHLKSIDGIKYVDDKTKTEVLMKNRKLEVKYFGKLGSLKFCLNEKNYTNKLKLFRQRVFQNYFFNVNTESSVIKKEFLKYNLNEVNYHRNKIN